MVTTIKATCPDCGDISVKDYDVTLRICLDNDEGSYRFRCPSCKNLVFKKADPVTVRLLSDTGAHQETWMFPLELSEPKPGGDPITDADITEFHDFLEADGGLTT